MAAVTKMPLCEANRAGRRNGRVPPPVAGFQPQHAVGGLVRIDEQGESVAIPSSAFICPDGLDVVAVGVNLYPGRNRRSRCPEGHRAGVQIMRSAVERNTATNLAGAEAGRRAG